MRGFFVWPLATWSAFRVEQLRSFVLRGLGLSATFFVIVSQLHKSHFSIRACLDQFKRKRVGAGLLTASIDRGRVILILILIIDR